ncbi:hypothetical protein GLOIN_2v1620036 [Rhizophagus irregularis DAOM 181602=DAOM 197198]|uniref:Uncharacterized protein n=1 Tax=Rhizophagus irregularis (strain DAOM 181602 / DAOM 197198 / MUCL 43194) TaxID=747089 RepID=A0A2P4PXQ1_RHIID|nr:hypothetical protein GLOIN_2v1620036 [Rhizophagus irregularis DAOM 181602=DAOM 197198]POG70171.1 hypothetical protein GLOIN_2v1620036 [Rhizophagus irregularis DAOM 181602=DAOM 197198]|eukprot:XP_025177037.1 hypothetical protein GLOIN_2v1620036 [Rhizophagus irregularis DAOM 181602=DAOM 197198]
MKYLYYLQICQNVSILHFLFHLFRLMYLRHLKYHLYFQAETLLLDGFLIRFSHYQVFLQALPLHL